METKIVKIRTKKGGIITRKALVTRWIRNDGSQFHTCTVGTNIYHIVDHDFDGPIYSIKKLPFSF